MVRMVIPVNTGDSALWLADMQHTLITKAKPGSPQAQAYGA
jgi:hypothetical protein